MCLDILKDPAKALLAARKKTDMRKTFIALVESSIIFAVASAVMASRIGVSAGLILASLVLAFVAVWVITFLLGLIVHISAYTLTSKGKYHDGLTPVVYGMLHISVGFLAASILSWIPFSTGVQIIVLALMLASGVSTIYRGIKELYRTDMVTALVVVSISVLVIFLAVYASVGLTMLNRFAVLGMMA